MKSSQFLTLTLFAALACRCVNGDAECFPEQRSLLLDLKHGFTTFPPEELVSWEPSSNCCNWEGIACDPKSGHVIGLDLSGLFLNGSINSDALFGLTSLRTLNLSNNRFDGISIPQPGFEKLKELWQLDLSNAGFTGQIPIGISCLAGLEYLDLSGCYRPTGFLVLRNPSFHTIIRDLNNLRVLNLGCVDLRQDVGWGTALLTSVPQLQLLDLSSTNLTECMKSLCKSYSQHNDLFLLESFQEGHKLANLYQLLLFYSLYTARYCSKNIEMPECLERSGNWKALKDKNVTRGKKYQKKTIIHALTETSQRTIYLNKESHITKK